MKLLSAALGFFVAANAIVAAQDSPETERQSPSASMLRSFAEQPWESDDSAVEERYRFVYWPTFNQPHLFRLDVVAASSGVLFVKRLSGRGGYENGELDYVRTLKLRGERFTKLLETLRKPEAYQPYGDLQFERILTELEGFDGTGWYLERKSAEGCKCSYVLSPKALVDLKPMIIQRYGGDYEQLNLGPFISACESLLAAGRLQFDSDGDKLKKRKTANKAQK